MLTGVDEIVAVVDRAGLTTGEISAHFAEVYGASVTKETVSKITDKVIEEMRVVQPAAGPGLPVIFIDAIVRHEALCYRAEVKDLHRLAVAAAWVKLGAA